MSITWYVWRHVGCQVFVLTYVTGNRSHHLDFDCNGGHGLAKLSSSVGSPLSEPLRHSLPYVMTCCKCSMDSTVVVRSQRLKLPCLDSAVQL